MSQAARRPHVARMILTDFRSYPMLDLDVPSRMTVLTGDNGVGKTNLLEAVSLLGPGRGLRRAEIAECARDGGGGGWAVAVTIHDDDVSVQLGTGLEAGDGFGAATRKY